MRYAVKRERREGKDEEGCSKTSGHFSFKDDGDDVVVTSLLYTVPINFKSTGHRPPQFDKRFTEVTVKITKNLKIWF